MIKTIPNIDIYYIVKDNCNDKAKYFLNLIISKYNARPMHENTLFKDTSYLFVIGGDGLYTYAMRQTLQKCVNIIGFNSGKRGFLMNNCPLDDIEVDNLINNLDNMYQITVYPFRVVCTDINDHQHTFFSFSDIYVMRDYLGILDFTLQVEKLLVKNIIGDGIIVSTPLGSTGYNYSAGGNIIPFYQGSQNISVINPVNTYNPRNMKSICYFSENTVSIYINNNDNKNIAKFMIDGSYIGDYYKVKISIDRTMPTKLIYNSFEYIEKKIFQEQTI